MHQEFSEDIRNATDKFFPVDIIEKTRGDDAALTSNTRTGKPRQSDSKATALEECSTSGDVYIFCETEQTQRIKCPKIDIKRQRS